jgi:hypothetical protein
MGDGDYRRKSELHYTWANPLCPIIYDEIVKSNGVTNRSAYFLVRLQSPCRVLT